jgi:hypothetical protein
MAKKVKAKVVKVVKAEKPEITVKETSKPIKVDAAVRAGHIGKAMKRYLKNKGK